MIDDDLRRRINAILSLARAQDWADRAFSLQKAQVCAELCSIVYEDVQEYELKKASRIHLFASQSYKAAIQSGTTRNVLESLVREEKVDAQFFLIRSRYAITLGVNIGDVVILAIRGTVFRRLWDWKANVDARKYYLRGILSPDELVTDDQFFHRGFFESIATQLPSIDEELKRCKDNMKSRPKVVWTGHSLGGAMAACGYALHERLELRRVLNVSLAGEPAGSYTFGMPRYCGLGGMLCLPSPFHLYRRRDIVPTVPPRRMGFSDCAREFEVSDDGTVALTERTDTFGIAGHLPRLLTSIRAHSIEGYASAIARALGSDRP